jgi:hypothetical protein
MEANTTLGDHIQIGRFLACVGIADYVLPLDVGAAYPEAPKHERLNT